MSHSMFFTLFEFLLAFIVLLALFQFVAQNAEHTLFEKNYLSRDFALLLNTIYAAPGDITYTYAEGTQKFSFDASGNQVRVMQLMQGQKDELPVSYPYFQNMQFPLSAQALQEKRPITIKKAKAGVLISTSPLPENSLE